MNPLRRHPFQILVALSIASLAGTAMTARAEDQIKNVSMTRSMLVFSDLEKSLAKAISKHDQAATDTLLSADFELRPGEHPGEPTTRSDWLADAASGQLGDIEELSVHDHGDVAVASFVRTVAASDNPTNLIRSYVIDVWKKQDNDWQLVTRYQSELPAVEAPTEDVAPTGKG
jgi:hypothetical protein